MNCVSYGGSARPHTLDLNEKLLDAPVLSSVVDREHWATVLLENWGHGTVAGQGNSRGVFPEICDLGWLPAHGSLGSVP